MAVVRIGSTTWNAGEYMCALTDLEATWPTDVGDGSTMMVFNESTHVLDSTKVFFNGNWNALA